MPRGSDGSGADVGAGVDPGVDSDLGSGGEAQASDLPKSWLTSPFWMTRLRLRTPTQLERWRCLMHIPETITPRRCSPGVVYIDSRQKGIRTPAPDPVRRSGLAECDRTRRNGGARLKSD
jgi:hypothetical protein